MRHQDVIYNQTGYGKKNETIPVVSTSSDICVFNLPFFSMSGASKINCETQNCSLSGVSLNDISTDTTKCFTIAEMSGDCFTNIVWSTDIYEDDVLTNSDIFYTSTTISDIPTFSQFSGSVVSSFNELGYSYSFSGSQYTIKQNNFSELRLNIGTKLNYIEDCPLTGTTSSGTTFTGTCDDISTEICDLDFTATTIDSQGVYNITGQTTIDLDFNFTGNTYELGDNNTSFNFEIFQYNSALEYYIEPSVYKSKTYEWPSYSATSAITATVPLSSLTLDNEFLVKGYFGHDICTEFSLINGDRTISPKTNNGSEYRLYEPDRDFHFSAFNAADTPILDNTVDDTGAAIGALIVGGNVRVTDSRQMTLPISESDFIVSLNGITLQKDLDYTISGNTLSNTLTFNGDIIPGDVVTYAYTSTRNNRNLRAEGFEITKPIISGATNGEGEEKAYYNNTNGKYEIYTDLKPAIGNSVIVTINGVTLSNNIDYFFSTTNPKRIILQGNIVLGDVINIFYNSVLSGQGDISSTSFSVAWNINIAPQTTNGLFTVEFSSKKDFSSLLTTSATTKYTIGDVTYSAPIQLSGNIGDKQYYRVKNEKTYKDMCGNPFKTTAYSEIIDITIQTNAFNSY